MVLWLGERGAFQAALDAPTIMSPRRRYGSGWFVSTSGGQSERKSFPTHRAIQLKNTDRPQDGDAVPELLPPDDSGDAHASSGGADDVWNSSYERSTRDKNTRGGMRLKLALDMTGANPTGHVWHDTWCWWC